MVMMVVFMITSAQVSQTDSVVSESGGTAQVYNKVQLKLGVIGIFHFLNAIGQELGQSKPSIHTNKQCVQKVILE